MRGEGAGEAVALLRLRGRAADVGAHMCVVLRLLQRQRAHTRAIAGLLAPRHLGGGLLALVAAVADDVGHRAHEAHSEPLLARARPQPARPRAPATRGGAVEYVLGAGPALRDIDVDAGPVREEGGGGGFLVLLGLLGRGAQEGIDVVVVVGGGGGGRLGGGLLNVVLGEVLVAPASALGHQLAGGLLGRFSRLRRHG